MNGNLTDILRLTLVLFPCMLKSAPHENEVVVAKNLNVIAYDASVSGTILNEVYLHISMTMERISVLFLMTLYEMVAVFLGEARNFRYYVIHIYNLVMYYVRFI